jgi:hypothetical protein
MLFLQYHTFFLIRRLAYAGVIIWFKNIPFYQNWGCVIWFISIFSYQIIFKSFRRDVYNVIMTINETTLVVISWLFYFYVSIDTDTQKIATIGWVILFMIVAVVVLNIWVLWTLKIVSWSKNIKSLIQSYRGSKKKNIHDITNEQDVSKDKFMKQEQSLNDESFARSNFYKRKRNYQFSSSNLRFGS